MDDNLIIAKERFEQINKSISDLESELREAIESIHNIKTFQSEHKQILRKTHGKPSESKSRVKDMHLKTAKTIL